MKIYEYMSMVNETGNVYLEKGSSYKVDGRVSYNSSPMMARFIQTEIKLQNRADEYVYAICLNTKANIIGVFQCSHGTVNGSLFPIRETMQKALLIGAVCICLCHNHPSGDPTPSGEDIDATKKIIEAGKIVGIHVLDHIVVGGGNNTYASLMELGLM